MLKARNMLFLDALEEELSRKHIGFLENLRKGVWTRRNYANCPLKMWNLCNL